MLEEKRRSIHVMQSTSNRKSRFTESDLKRHLEEIENELTVLRPEIESWLAECDLAVDKKDACRSYYIQGMPCKTLEVELPYISNLERDVKRELGVLNTKKKES